MAEIDRIFEEIDEQLEQERVQKLWLKYRFWIMGGLVALFSGLFAYVGWDKLRRAEDDAAATLYLEALTHGDAARASLEKLREAHAGQGYDLLAGLLLAREQAAAGETAQAITTLDGVINSSHAPDALRDLALYHGAQLTLAEPGRADGYLQRISADSAYRANALELKGLLAEKAGMGDGAVAAYTEALGKQPAPTLKRRLEDRLRLLRGAPPAATPTSVSSPAPAASGS
ncbi:MAG: tetratricopeptide repeat protein [Magnetococcus sp. WYHC-3]